MSTRTKDGGAIWLRHITIVVGVMDTTATSALSLVVQCGRGAGRELRKPADLFALAGGTEYGHSAAAPQGRVCISDDATECVGFPGEWRGKCSHGIS